LHHSEEVTSRTIHELDSAGLCSEQLNELLPRDVELSNLLPKLRVLHAERFAHGFDVLRFGFRAGLFGHGQLATAAVAQCGL
jgi:hypothetical protein